MPPNRYGKKRDANEKTIVKGLEKAGYFVARIDGTDIPDLIVCKHDRPVFVEVKDPESYGKVTDGQQAWHDKYRHFGGEVIVAETLEDVLVYYGDMEAERKSA